MKAMLQILRLWRSSAGWLLGGLLFSLASLTMGIALLTVAGASIGGGVAADQGALLVAGLSALLLLRVLGVSRVVLRYLERLITHGATFRALARLRVWFFRGFAAGSAGGLGFRRAGDAVGRLVDDIEALDGLYLRILVPLGGALLLLPVLLWLIGAQDVGLALVVALLLVVGAFLIPALAARMAWSGGGEVTRAGAGLRIAVLDAMSGLREVRAFGAEGRMRASVRERQEHLMAAQARLARQSAWANAGTFLCAQAAVFAVLLAAGAQRHGAIALLFLTLAAFDTILILPRAGAMAGHAAEAAARVVSAAAPQPRLLRPSVNLPTGTTLRFENIGFRWQTDRPAVFENLTMEIAAGSRVAVLGPSGSGKSTLAALALKVVAPDIGRVMFGGVDIATLNDTELRSRISWLSQATHLFNDSIRNNLLLAKPNASDPELWTALAAARMDDVVRELPDGLDTWVGESGRGFSGGQGRRLVLARALLSPAPLLILDEPCTGLDADNERAFLATLNEAAEGRSVMLIAHRLTGVERLDRIWRLSGGRAMAAMA
jgi:ATP-binding cassette subfamily C protein CydC